MTATPAHWSRGRLKWDATLAAGGTPSTDADEYWLAGEDPEGVPFVAISDMSRRDHVTSTAKAVSTEGLASRGLPTGSPGTLLLAMYASVGEIAVLDITATWSQALLGIAPDPNRTDATFLKYVLLNMRDDLLREARSNTQPNLNAGQIASIWFDRPPLREQRAIADFLDRETARIDTLIEEQQRLIGLLRERRQAVLSRVFQPAAKTVRLGHLLSGIKDGTHGTFQRVDPDHGKPLLGARNLIDGRLVVDGQESFVSEADADAITANGYPMKGDVLLVIVGATIGKTAVFDRPDTLAFQRSVAFLRPTSRLNPYYLWFQIQSDRFQDELALRAKTSAQPGIYLGDVSAIPVVAPSLEEQRSIVEYLTQQTAGVDGLIAETERFIELAQERRSALITAAVTGQIDVSSSEAVGVG